MTFSRKIFIAVFLSTLVVGSILIWASYRYTVDNSERDFISRYKVFTNVLGDTLRRLDVNTETLMQNAARVVVEKESKERMLSTIELRQLQRELGITHLFLINNKGTFVRSTNEDPKTIPNLFSFCENYKKLVTGELNVEATPIIKPSPEPRPFKFLSIPSHDRSHIVEVGIRVDFIAKALAEASASDQNIESMSLYSPDGTPFGTFSDESVNFSGDKTTLPSDFKNPIWNSDNVSFFTKVLSSHSKCCECDINGTSKNGEYYYVLESRVSKNELKRIEARAGLIFLLTGLGNLILSFVLARALSRRLVRNIEIAVRKVRMIKSSENLKRRIGLKTGDEISVLTEEVDRLLDVRENTRDKLIHAERMASKVELARVVAHNIRSPVLALEMALPTLSSDSDQMKNVVKNAVAEIKDLSDKLKNHSSSMVTDPNLYFAPDLVLLPNLVEDIVHQKRLEFSSIQNNKITFSSYGKPQNLYVKSGAMEFRSVLSNIINNAVESYGGKGGEVAIILTNDGDYCSLKVMDRGGGIPSEIIPTLGKKSFSLKAEIGRGLGLSHAFSFVEGLDGKIEISSQLKVGTTVEIRLPLHLASESDLIGNQGI